MRFFVSGMWWCGSWREDRRLPFHRLPVLDPAGLGGEVHPDFVELAWVGAAESADGGGVLCVGRNGEDRTRDDADFGHDARCWQAFTGMDIGQWEDDFEDL